MSVQRYRSKPKPPETGGMFVAKYEPGQPLDDLIRVARMTGSDAEVAEAPLPSGTVLVARWRRYFDEHPSEIEYEVIAAGDYLTYSEGYGSLDSADDAELRQWYEPAS